MCEATLCSSQDFCLSPSSEITHIPRAKTSLTLSELMEFDQELFAVFPRLNLGILDVSEIKDRHYYYLPYYLENWMDLTLQMVTGRMS